MKHVIFVDQDAEMAEMVNILLADQAIVYEIHHPDKLLKSVERLPHSAMYIFDYFMPQVSAEEFVNKVRAANPDAEFLMTTACPDYVEKATQLSVRYFLQHPLDPDEVVDIVKEWMESTNGSPANAHGSATG